MTIEPRFYCLIRVNGRRARFLAKTQDGKAKIVYGTDLTNWHQVSAKKRDGEKANYFDNEYVHEVAWSALVLPHPHPVGRFEAPVIFANGERGTRKCAAVFVGSFVVHRPAANGFDLDGQHYRFDEWDISHKSSGYRIAAAFDDVALAIDIAEQLDYFVADIFASMTGDSQVDARVVEPHKKLIRELLQEGGGV